MDNEEALDAEELMNLADRIDLLPPTDAEWVNRLFMECMRARMDEAELLSGMQGRAANVDNNLEEQLAQVALDTAE